MTLEELKVEAYKQGYRLTRLPWYDCRCAMPYPRKARCAEFYREVKKDGYKGGFTHCVRKIGKETENDIIRN